MKTKILLSSFLLCFVLQSHGQWTWTFDSLSQPRNWMGAACFGTKAYFAGGESDFGNASLLEIYDVATGTWDTPANLSVGRSTITAVACDSLVFFAGGFDYNSLAATSVVDIWDTRTQQWSIPDVLSIPRFALSAVSKDHKALFAGGVIYNLTCYNRVDIYDTQTETWSTATLSLSRGAMASAVVGDLAIFAGGTTTGGAVTNRVDIYNFTTDTWSIASLSQARCQAEATTIGNKVVIAGGMTAGFANPSDVVDIYDAVTDTWTTANLSFARMSCGAATINGKAYFAGGGSFASGAVLSDFSDVIDIYDPVSDTWTVNYLSQPVASHSVLAIGKHLLVAGGKTDGGVRVKTVEILDMGVGITSKVNEDAFFRVYPNPSTGNFHLKIFKENHLKPLLATIYNLQGQVVFTQSLEQGNQELNVKLADGIYLLNVLSDNITHTKLITIQN